MRKSHILAALTVAAIAATGCADQTSATPMYTRATLKQCVAIYPNGNVEAVDDDFCEDDPYHVLYHWWYGGTTVYVHAAHPYYLVHGGTRTYPGGPLVSRDVRYGGSARTQTFVQANNREVARWSTTSGGLAKYGAKNSKARSGDDNRSSFGSKGTTSTRVSLRSGRR